MVVTEVASIITFKWSCYRGVLVTLKHGGENGLCAKIQRWSCYRGGQFNGGRMVILRRRPV